MVTQGKGDKGSEEGQEMQTSSYKTKKCHGDATYSLVTIVSNNVVYT